MNKPVAISETRKIARPLKVLVPMIQGELQQGNAAGHEHYQRAGEMLLEARDQVAHGGWGRWLAKNFELTPRTANVYMQWARHAQEQIGRPASEIRTFQSLNEMRGGTARAREDRQSKQQQDFKRVMRDLARDNFVQGKQARDDEVRLHRELAAELVDAGYRALATRLHPDRGGSKDAMARLNRVRDDLKQIAKTRRFI